MAALKRLKWCVLVKYWTKATFTLHIDLIAQNYIFFIILESYLNVYSGSVLKRFSQNWLLYDGIGSTSVSIWSGLGFGTACRKLKPVQTEVDRPGSGSVPHFKATRLRFVTFRHTTSRKSLFRLLLAFCERSLRNWSSLGVWKESFNFSCQLSRPERSPRYSLKRPTLCPLGCPHLSTQLVHGWTPWTEHVLRPRLHI